MTTKNFIAKAETDIEAPVEKIWDALVNPATIKQYMFGTTVTSDWKQGSPITWEGEWEGKPYKDYGKILVIDPHHRLKYTHISGSDQTSDENEKTHTVNIILTNDGHQTHVTLEQDNNKNDAARSESEKNWNMMLKGMKSLLEKK